MLDRPCEIGPKPESMSVEAIQDELNALLFDKRVQRLCDAKDRELLSIIIAQPKVHHFNFLKERTTWKVRGQWIRPDDEYRIERNIQLDVEFKDAPDECVGKRLVELLKGYNTKVIKERVLYARTIPIEEGTL